jgi:putative N6-adenine-specific DNA methylase/tRNA (guanine6-N2)-methyltransferase
MLVHSGFADAPGPLLDPFCGAGTVLLEAASVAAEQGVPNVLLIGNDREPAAVIGARDNLVANGAEARILDYDANELKPNLASGSLSYIVTNPPYGARIGKKIDYYLLYQNLLAIAAHALVPGGRLVLLVERNKGAFDSVRKQFRKLADRNRVRVSVGGLRPEMVVLERTP